MTRQLEVGGGEVVGGGRGRSGGRKRPRGVHRGGLGRVLAGNEVAEVLELCVGCKACKRECPAGVDMARMKAEVLHMRNRELGTPLRERVFASLPRVAPVAARMPGLLNLLGRNRVLRWAGERALGIAAARALPEWNARPFRDRESNPVTDSVTDSPMNLSARAHSEGVNQGSRPPLTLFVDTFHRYFDADVVRAACDVLRRLGYDPVAPSPQTAPRRPLCCGRTYISAGLLDHARAELRRTLAALAPLARQGLPIVGLEPSCLLTLRDESLHLCPGDDARRVADHAFLVDEFLAARCSPAPSSNGNSRGHDAAHITRDTTQAPVHIHGHCHQKAAGTDTDTAAVLTALTGSNPIPIESSCCGLAGSFGYMAKHRHTSRAMAELGLFPALRAAPPSDIVVANGFSCRAQIRDGTGRRARHLVEVLAERLGG